MTTLRDGRGGYFCAPDSIFDHGLDPYCLAVMLNLYRRVRGSSTESPSCFPSIGRVASDTGMSKSKVSAVIGELEELGHIKIDRRQREDGSQASNEYTLFTPPIPRSTVYPLHNTGGPLHNSDAPPLHNSDALKEDTDQKDSIPNGIGNKPVSTSDDADVPTGTNNGKNRPSSPSEHGSDGKQECFFNAMPTDLALHAEQAHVSKNTPPISPHKPKREKQPNFPEEFFKRLAATWKEKAGAWPPFGQMRSDFRKNLFGNQWSEAEIEDGWNRYVAETDLQWLRVGAFTSKPAQWCRKNGGQSGPPRGVSAEEFRRLAGLD